MKNVWLVSVSELKAIYVHQLHNFLIFQTFFRKTYVFKVQIWKHWLFYTDLHLSTSLAYTTQSNWFLLVNYFKHLHSMNKKPTNCLIVLTSCLPKAVYFVESQISNSFMLFPFFPKGFQFYMYSYNDNSSPGTNYLLNTRYCAHVTMLHLNNLFMRWAFYSYVN